MADVVKVKPKRNFEWEQDTKSIRVTVNMPDHKSMKNVDIFLSDLFLRITSKQKKTSQVLDFCQEVDYLSAENKFVLVDGKIIATLKKKNVDEKWEKLLVEDLSHEEIKERRKESQARYESNIKEVQKTKEKLRVEYDRMGTKELMRFEEEERKKLQGRKRQEKEEALNEVFRNVNEKTGKIQYEGKKWNDKGKEALEKMEKQQQQERKRKQLEKKKEREEKILDSTQPKQNQPQNNSMFTFEDVKKFDQMRNKLEDQEEMEEIPVRKAAKVNLKFTQKPYPTVAARDYHYTEAPLPKGSVPLPPTKGDLENKNPLWLKDKGDKFMKDKNYQSAIEAYNESLKLDPKHIKSLMNRSLAHMKRFNLESCINDCDASLLQMQSQIVNSEEGNNEAFIDLVKIRTRKAICLGWKGKFKQSKELIEEQLIFQGLPENVSQELKNCLESINKREQSLRIKMQGDELVKRNNHSQAIKYYDQAIQIDSNEYAISNKCLCLNKESKFKESLQAAETGLKRVNEFGVGTSDHQNREQNSIVLKLLYRKAKAYQGQNMMKQSSEVLKKGLEINPQDKDFKNYLKEIKTREVNEELKKKKVQASELLKKDNAEGALEIYSYCMKMLQNSDNMIDYLSILQNQCVCYLKLKQFDSIISTSIRILKITSNLKNKIVQFGEKKNVIDKAQLDKISVRTLMRRANAYLKTGQIYNAKSDLEKAASIDPKDENIKKELEKLKSSI